MKQASEMAKQLYEEFYFVLPTVDDGGETEVLVSKRCATIAINEIIKYHDSLFELGLKNVHQTMNTPTEIYNDVMNPQKDYLEQVKQEIEKII